MPAVFNLPGVPSLPSYLSGAPPALLATDLALSLGQSALQWGIYDQNGVPVIASVLSPLFNLGGLSSIFSALNSVSAFLTGQQLINQFSVVDFEYKQDWNISTAPVEQGGFQAYNKVQLPFDIRMRVAAGGALQNRESLLTILDNLANAGLSAGIPGAPTIVNTFLSAPSLLSGVVSSITGTASAIPLFNVLAPEKIYLNMSVSHYDYKRTSINGLGVIVADIWLLEIRQTATSSFTNTQLPTAAGQQAQGSVQPGASQPLTITFN